MQKGLRLSYLIIFTEQLIIQIQEIDYRLTQYVEYITIQKCKIIGEVFSCEVLSPDCDCDLLKRVEVTL
jgi:hypothetical protein